MEYLSKPEVMDYLTGYRKQLILLGKDGNTITEIINHLNGMYSFRPTLQSQWIRKGKADFITCSRCGFKTLAYKNSKYCPNCGRSMVNGKSEDERRQNE